MELYDQALLGILQHVGNVQDFLRVLFGFLYRKTDFYRLLRQPSDRMGFPPGAAQALVLQVRRVQVLALARPSGRSLPPTARGVAGGQRGSAGRGWAPEWRVEAHPGAAQRIPGWVHRK